MFSKLRNVVRNIALMILSSYGRIWDFYALTERRAMYYIYARIEDEKLFDRTGKMDAEDLKKFIEPNSVVLDLGCGIGRVEKFLAPCCKEIHGVDASRMMIHWARKRLKNHKNIYLYKNNGRDLSIFPDRKFDFVFSVQVFQHLEREDFYLYLTEIYRVLRAGGKAYFKLPNFLNKSHACHFAKYATVKDRDVARIRYYTLPEVKKMLEMAGFNIVSLTTNQDITVLVSAEK